MGQALFLFCCLHVLTIVLESSLEDELIDTTLSSAAKHPSPRRTVLLRVAIVRSKQYCNVLGSCRGTALSCSTS